MKKATVIIIILIMSVVLAACGGQTDEVPDRDENLKNYGTTPVYDESLTEYDGVPPPDESLTEPDTVPARDENITQRAASPDRDENLVKLGKVWGFVKYTHDAFISGRLDWDAELLSLIPVIYYSDAADANGILYDWFIGLGEDGYDFAMGHDFDLADYLAELAAQVAAREIILRAHRIPLEILYGEREFYAFFNAKLADGYDLDWLSFERLAAETFPNIATTDEMEMYPMADLTWINYGYLGPLAAHLQRFDGIRAVDRTAAPVSRTLIPNAFHGGIPIFSNKNLHANMDFSDTGYRLLGLFRLWNAMKYYFPHHDVLDAEWNGLLLEFIPKMLEGTDKQSYELTLMALTHHLYDAHVFFGGTGNVHSNEFGRFVAPVQLIAAEGRLVVYDVFRSTVPLVRGDVILGLNGRCIDEVTAEMRPFISYPNEEKFLAYLAGRVYGRIHPTFPHAMRSHTARMEVDILRDGVEMTLTVTGLAEIRSASSSVQPYVLMENNIGLVNPAFQSAGDVRRTMEAFADTDGIIIDLRQRPVYGGFSTEMIQYLMAESGPVGYMSFPALTHPGMRVIQMQYNTLSPHAYAYDRPVVLLMDEQTFSYPEWVIMMFRTAPNVTVMGPYSMGSNGSIAPLPLPGGIIMQFTSIGVYTPEGGQTHRIGLTPDIRVDRTIQGIAEGRDELIEAAIRFILYKEA